MISVILENCEWREMDVHLLVLKERLHSDTHMYTHTHTHTHTFSFTHDWNTTQRWMSSARE